MQRFHHPTILQLKAISFKPYGEGKKNLEIITNYAEKGSLNNFCTNIISKQIDDTIRQIFLVGITYGLMIFHKNNHIHRDLKPPNVLVNEHFHPIISDFRFSKPVDQKNPLMQTAPVGTLPYMAPEVFTKKYGRKADVYAFGISMYEIIARRPAYQKLGPQYEFMWRVSYSGLRPKRRGKLGQLRLKIQFGNYVKNSGTINRLTGHLLRTFSLNWPLTSSKAK